MIAWFLGEFARSKEPTDLDPHPEMKSGQTPAAIKKGFSQLKQFGNRITTSKVEVVTYWSTRVNFTPFPAVGGVLLELLMVIRAEI